MKRDKTVPFLIPGTMRRPENDWCDKCMKGTLWLGSVYTLNDKGVTVWGTLLKCWECEERVWTDLKGVIHNITLVKGAKEKDEQE